MTLEEAPAPAMTLGATHALLPAVRFTGHTNDYLGLLARGAVRLALTLGIYRFWLETDKRRFLWSHTAVAGEPLEYTGTAAELLIGFLIAIAVLVPIYLIFFIVSLSMGETGQVISALAFPILIFLGQFAVYRARRYRLTRTIYRGIRCHQGGSALRYAVCAIFWWLLIFLTLGLAYPFAQSQLERYKMRHTYFGDLQGAFEGSGLRLFLRGLPMWLLVIGPLAFAMIYSVLSIEWGKLGMALTAGGPGAQIGERLNTVPGLTTTIAVASSLLTLGAAAAILLFLVFQAMVFRWWLSGIRLGHMTLRSHMRTWSIYAAYLRLLVIGLLFLIVVSILAAAATALTYTLLRPNIQRETVELLGTGGAVIFYVFVMLGFSTIYQATVKLSLWRHGAESIELEGIDALDRVRASGTPSSAVGEGLADALNMGGF